MTTILIDRAGARVQVLIGHSTATIVEDKRARLDIRSASCEQTGRAAEAQELAARAQAIRDKNAQIQTST